MLIDIGANLAHDSFDLDLENLLLDAHRAELEAIIITGSCRASNAKALKIIERFREHATAGSCPKLYTTAGCHPHHAAEWDETLAAQIAQHSTMADVVALGECGLDYFRNFAPHEAQKSAFISQLGLAIQADKPVFLHQRDAHADFLPILRDYRKALRGACVHCFTDTQQALEDYLALDCYIGITGWVADERRGQGLREIVRHIPIERLLIETDAPYLMPQNAHPKPRHRRNEPALLPWVLRAVAHARGQSPDYVAEHTTANAKRFFAIAE